MTKKNNEEYIKYRFRRAKESYEESLILAEKEKWNAVINRLYYSCFYAVIALLLKHNIEAQTYDGVRTQFGFHFIKTGKLDKDFGKLYSKLFDFRQKGDYGDLYDFDKEVVSPLITQVNHFITEIAKYF